MISTALSLLLLLGAAPDESAAPPPERTTAAEAEAPKCYPDKARVLRRHAFLFPTLQSWAFVTTHVGIRENVSRETIPDLPVGRLGTTDILLRGARQDLDLGLSLLPWLGVEGTAQIDLATGANAHSLVANGAATETGGEAGLVFRLWRGEASGTQLALRANAGYIRGNEVSIFPFVNSILNNPLLTLEDVLQGNFGQLIRVPYRETQLNAGVYLAQAFNRTLSLEASANGLYGWRTRHPFDPAVGGRIDQDSKDERVNLAAAFTADFAPEGVPVALLGEYRFTGGRETEVDLPDIHLSAHTVALSAYYTGRPHLQVGLGAAATFHGPPARGLGAAGEARESGHPTISYGYLILRYIW